MALSLAFSQAVFVASSATGAELHDPNAAYAVVSRCLSDARADPAAARACIGVASTPCGRDARGDRVIAEAKCVAAEGSAWDRALNEDYGRARARLDAAGRRVLLDAQRKWLAFRDAGCAVWASAEAGDRGRARRLDCLRTQTALRTIDLRALAAPASSAAR
ncbi:MAG: lysozyme inhibitor LprI family protein [Pseudomonadota bacterium]